LSLILFYVLAAVIVVSAILVVTLRNVFHSALFLVLAFFTVAGIYLMLHAEFLAAVQVLIYVGAITILMLFAIMLTYQIQSKSIRQVNEQAIPAALIAAVFLVLALFTMSKTFGHINRPLHNQGAWTASIDIADLPSDDPSWNWTASLEDASGQNYVAGGNFFVMPQRPVIAQRPGPSQEISTPAGYLISHEADFSILNKAFGPGETVNLKVWSDNVNYGSITDATWKITSSSDTSATLTRNLINSNPENIGRLLMSKFVLPFEVVSVLLLVALIGAIVIARKDA
jgi:NADH:ubiquinone oxidoreductase subunit 6 (subunit J)